MNGISKRVKQPKMMGKAIKKKNNKKPVTLIVLPDEVTLPPVIPPEETDPSDDEEEEDDEPEDTLGKKMVDIGLGGSGSPIGGVGLLLLDGLDGWIDDDSVTKRPSNSLVVVGGGPV
jgi:hypothetical protein